MSTEQPEDYMAHMRAGDVVTLLKEENPAPMIIQMRADTSALVAAAAQLESLLGELEPQTLEVARKRIDLFLSSNDLLVIEQLDMPAGTRELVIGIRPSDSFDRFLAALRTGKRELIIADIEHEESPG